MSPGQQLNIEWGPRLASAARIVAALVLAVGVLVWLAWIFDWPAVTRLVLSGPSMKPNTASSLILCALALFFAAQDRPRPQLVLVCAALAGLLNLATVAEYAGNLDLHIDVHFGSGDDAAAPGRTSLASSFAFLALAGSLAALTRKRRGLTDVLALIGGAIGLLGIAMHIYQDALLRLSGAFTIAAHTALCFVLVATSVLAINTGGRVVSLMTSRSAGGSLARRLIPLSLLLPIALAWLSLIVSRNLLVTSETGLAFLAVAFIIVFTGISWWSASSLDRADTARAKATEAIELARQQAEQANKAKDDFLAMLGHELRNPLAPIVAALDRMKRFDKVAFAREREILERQAHHLERLVSDLLDVAKISRDSLELERAPVSLNKVLDAALEIATPTLKENGHQPVRESFDSDFWVHGDHARLVQLFVNLLNNASKHTPPGGRITIRLVRENKDVVITVRDAGAGIPPELLNKVFEHFVQEPQTIERRKGGLGLGLAIVRNVAELHGGSAKIESPGRNLGTTVTIRLPEIAAPVAPAVAVRPISVKLAAPQAAALAPIADPVAGATRVLVVDDNADAAEMLSLLLADSGYISMEAYDGEEALRVARDFDPAIVLLDIGLPKLNGYEVARRLRADPARKGIRLIAITGFGQPKDKLAAEDAGFDLFMVKPVEFAKLQPLMAGLLKSRT